MLTHSLEEVVRKIRRGANTRAKLLDELEWSRTTLTDRLDALTSSGILRAGRAQPSTGGRPATTLELDPDRGLILALDIGGSHARLALCRADATVIRTEDLEAGRDDGLPRISQWLRESVSQEERSRLIAIGAGLPVAPPQFTHETSSSPALEWEAFSPADVLEIAVPESFTRDVAVVARGEAEHPQVAAHALVVKIGLGLSTAIIDHHAVVDGAHGSAGTFLVSRGGALVSAETLFSGYSVRDQLISAGLSPHTTSSEIVALASGTSTLADATRDALHEMASGLGTALARMVAFIDPVEVLIGGNLGESSAVVEGVRAALDRSLGSGRPNPVHVRACRRGRQAGIAGAANLALDAITTQQALEQHIDHNSQEAA